MLISRLPQLEQGYSLDLDSMIFSRHGTQQQGAARGYHPRRPGRLSRHPLLAVLAEANFVYTVGCAVEMPGPVKGRRNS